VVLPAALIFLNSGIAKKNFQDREKPSAFECGFDPASKARIPFSMRFFLIAVVFLIFDVEITIILPIPVIINLTIITSLSILTAFFLLILITGLLHE